MDLSSLASTLVAMMSDSLHMQIDVRKGCVHKRKSRISFRCSDINVLFVGLRCHTIRPHMPLVGDKNTGTFMDNLRVIKDH